MRRAWLICVAWLLGCGSGHSSAKPKDAPVSTADAPLPDAPPDAAVPSAQIHFIGRFGSTTANMGKFAWPGSRIVTRFVGTSIAIDLGDSGQNLFDVTIDGTTTELAPTAGRNTYTLASALADGMHDLELAKRTESFFGTSTFYGFPGATLVATPNPQRMIEWIGDSITCGYGVLGAGPSCPFTPATEAETHAWGTFAASSLEAAHAAIAYSGIGMYRNNDGSTTSTMPMRYGLLIADDATSMWDFSYTPDAIVIDLGTNDFAAGDPGQPYIDAYVAFVQMLRGRFANASILLATSPMLGGTDRTTLSGYLATVATTLNDPKVTVVEIPEVQASDGYGCGYHPDETTQHAMATTVVAALHTATGW
jgi:hypothetical protein